MRHYLLAAAAAVSIFYGTEIRAQGVPTIDATAIANLKSQVSLLSQQFTAITSVVQQTQSMVNQIGYPIKSLINLPQQLSTFQSFSWYTPASASALLTSVPGLDWTSPTAARSSTQSLFYTPPPSGGGPITFDAQTTIQARRQAAVRDAATNAYTIVQQYRNSLASMQDDITRLTSEANGATIAQVEQANADISLTMLKYQVAQSNLLAAMAQLAAAQAIAADPSYTVSSASTSTP